MFDLFLLPVHVVDGQEQPDLPGILATVAPRRAERSRSGDMFLAMVSVGGNAPLSRSNLDELLQGAMSAYYRTRGPVTAGLRAAAEAINEWLIERNTRMAREGLQAYGITNLAVLRREQLYLASAGPTHSFVLVPGEAQDFHEPMAAGRGLGVGRTMNLSFYQTPVQAGSLLVLCPNPPTQWSIESLSSGSRLSLEHLRRRLLNQSGNDLSAAVVQFQNGAGLVRRLKPRATPATAPTVQPPDQVSATSGTLPPSAAPAVLAAGSPERKLPSSDQAVQSQLSASVASQPVIRLPFKRDARPVEEKARSVEDRPLQAQAAEAPPPEQLVGTEAPAISTQPELARQKSWRKQLTRLWFVGRNAGRRAWQASRTFARRLLPASSQPSKGLSPATKLFISIAVPLIVVAVAITVYFYAPGGRSEQHQAYLQQAQDFITQALAQQDRTLQHNDWQQALHALDKADEYGQSDTSYNLRRQVQEALDAMDGVTRLTFLSALPTDLAQNIQVTRLVANQTEIYALDGSQGRIYRLFQVGKGYEVDVQFQCGPGPSGTLLVGPLVDLAILPPNNQFKATVMAMDGSGNILFCIPGGPPIAATLPAPDPFWGEIKGFVFDQDVLYILDQKNNRIWLYVSKNLAFSDAPRLFFNNQVPTLSDVADMAVNGEDLFLLHQSGQMTICTFRTFSFSDTKCQDPAKYTDAHTGKERKVTNFPDTTFTQMVTSRPPDSSLYALDTSGESVYHFSLRLNLVRLLGPQPAELLASGERKLPTTPPTAFTVEASGRLVVLAFGNRIFYAELP